eukprot:jgi/Tetstr1/456763/TSEL_043460.t1
MRQRFRLRFDFAYVSSTTPTWGNAPRWCTPGIAATEAEHNKMAADRASSAPKQRSAAHRRAARGARGRQGGRMVYCKYCQDEVQVETDETNAISCCTSCGAVLEDVAFSSDVTFFKGADGGSEAVGTFVSNTGSVRGLSMGAGRGSGMYGAQGDSHERTVSKGRTEIQYLADTLNIRPRDDLVDAAHRLYRLALQHNFTRGRRTNQVAAACMYIVCREENRPFMMIDFSDTLQINIFTLGVVFLQLCQLLRLQDHPVLTRPVDPSLYIHRFADRLSFGKKIHVVVNTAIRLVASMKRDWMQTGRRPAGICGAALYIASHIHGFNHSKRDVMRVVHIGDQTLQARITEFAQTKSGSLTIEEFDNHAIRWKEEQEMMALRPPQEQTLALAAKAGKGSGVGGVGGVGEQAGAAGGEAEGEEEPSGYTVCVHMAEHSELHFAHGMCHACFVEYLNTTGGHMREGAADPPAFQKTTKKKRGRPRKHPALPEPQSAAASQKMLNEMDEVLQSSELSRLSAAFSGPEPDAPPAPSSRPPTPARALPITEGDNLLSNDCREMVVVGRPPHGDRAPSSREQSPVAARAPPSSSVTVRPLALPAPGDNPPVEEDGPLSDLDDDEVDNYINTEEEAKLKEVIWTHMNQDYLENQRAKEAALAAAAKVEEERKAAAALAGEEYEATKKRKYRKRVQADLPEAETAAQAAAQALQGRKLSTKIDYSMLDDLAIAAAWASRREEQEAAETAAEQHHRAALEADTRRGAKGGLGGLLGKQLPAAAPSARGASKRVRFAAGGAHEALD